MRVTAAIARSASEPFTLETLDLEDPRDDEIRVRVAAVGLSHADLLARDQKLTVPLPAVLGREAAGWVESVGAAVTKFTPGDHVVLTFRSSELLPGAAHHGPRYGSDVFELNFSGLRSDGSSPLSCDGEPIAGAFFGQSSFATHAIANEQNAVRVTNDIPFPLLAPLGGDFQTGAGVVINTLGARPGSAIAVFGVGAIGMSAVMAAQLAGCHPIIAVDIKASRLELAEKLGATHAFDPDGLDPAEAIRGITGSGAEFSVETTGSPDVVRRAVDCLAQDGICALAGAAASDAEAVFAMNGILLGRAIRGSLFGDSVPVTFIPRLIDLYKQGRFPIDRIITEYRFEHINEAAFDCLSGVAVKAVLVMPS